MCYLMETVVWPQFLEYLLNTLLRNYFDHDVGGWGGGGWAVLDIFRYTLIDIQRSCYNKLSVSCRGEICEIMFEHIILYVHIGLDRMVIIPLINRLKLYGLQPCKEMKSQK